MIATTIEQSKKLVELGINLNTADMYYPRWCAHAKGTTSVRVNNGNMLCDNKSANIPAWSLSALLKLMPLVFRYPQLLRYSVDGKFFCQWPGGPDYMTKDYDEPIDAAFEMIVWLKENNYI